MKRVKSKLRLLGRARVFAHTQSALGAWGPLSWAVTPLVRLQQRRAGVRNSMFLKGWGSTSRIGVGRGPGLGKV